jgi:hypothetical protein
VTNREGDDAHQSHLIIKLPDSLSFSSLYFNHISVSHWPSPFHTFLVKSLYSILALVVKIMLISHDSIQDTVKSMKI